MKTNVPQDIPEKYKIHYQTPHKTENRTQLLQEQREIKGNYFTTGTCTRQEKTAWGTGTPECQLQTGNNEALLRLKLRLQFQKEGCLGHKTSPNT